MPPLSTTRLAATQEEPVEKCRDGKEVRPMRQLVVVPASSMSSWTIGDAQTDDAGGAPSRKKVYVVKIETREG